MRDNTVICSVVDDGFVAGFIVMERTLRHHNPDWDAPIVAISNQANPLSDRARGLIREHCTNVHFAVAQTQTMAPIYQYAREVIGTPERLWPAFSILEALTWSEFDRVIALDSDMLIRGPLDPLLSAAAPFNAVRASHHRSDAPERFFNTGVMVFNRSLLLGFDISKIPDYIAGRKPRPGTGLADQAILNLLMPNAIVGWLPKRFNFTKRALAAQLGASDPDAFNDPAAIDDWLSARGVRIFHYVGEKPWNNKIRDTEKAYAAVDALWHEAASAFCNKSLFIHMQRQNQHWSERYSDSLRHVRKSRPNLSESAFEREVARAMGL